LRRFHRFVLFGLWCRSGRFHLYCLLNHQCLVFLWVRLCRLFQLCRLFLCCRFGR
jgi:hypothetical protein